MNGLWNGGNEAPKESSSVMSGWILMNEMICN